MEVWKDIKGYEGYYQVSNKGRVKSLERIIMRKNGSPQIIKERILKGINNSKGHYHVRLQKESNYEQLFIHRLVAQAFIPKPNGCEIIHHKDYDPTNNRVENLEWMTDEEHNALHTIEKKKKVYQYTIDGKYIETWPSASEVERILGYDQSSICRCCNGGFKRNNKWININSANGYKWSYRPL